MRFSKEESKILYVSDRDGAASCSWKISMFNAMQHRGFNIHFMLKKGTKGTHYVDVKTLLPTLRKGNFTDLWLANAWIKYRRGTLRGINNLGIYVVGFGFCDPISFTKNTLRQINLHASNDLEVARALQRKGFPSLFFPAACDTNFHKNLNLEKTTDILIYGAGKHPNLHPREYRINVANKIYKKFKNKNIKLYGKKWNYLHCEGMISGEQFLEEINKAKVSIDITQKKGQLARRIFECGACGTAVITRDRPEIRKLFTPNKDILVYNSTEELLKKIEYILKNTESRETLSKNIYKTCITKHNISNRVEKLLEIIHLERTKWETNNR